MTAIADNLFSIQGTLPVGVKLVAVSKFQPIVLLQEAYAAGQRLFGENRPQELDRKIPCMPSDVAWHFIGHLQTNKVPLVVGRACLIHSIDSLRLLQAVEEQASRLNIVQPVLLQLHIAREETKQGFSYEQACQALDTPHPHLRVTGLMGMATLTADTACVRKEFAFLRTCFEQMKAQYFPQDPDFCEVSMGMSGDYRIAVEQGSTMVRIGSAIFPPRPQKQDAPLL